MRQTPKRSPRRCLRRTQISRESTCPGQRQRRESALPSRRLDALTSKSSRTTSTLHSVPQWSPERAWRAWSATVPSESARASPSSARTECSASPHPLWSPPTPPRSPKLTSTRVGCPTMEPNRRRASRAADSRKSAADAATTLGPVPASELGRVMPHEHLLSLTPGPWLTGGVRDDAVDRAVDALASLAGLGFKTIVDLSPYGVVGRDDNGDNAALLIEISRKSGLHIVSGSAFYLESYAPAWVQDADTSALTTRLIRDAV